VRTAGLYCSIRQAEQQLDRGLVRPWRAGAARHRGEDRRPRAARPLRPLQGPVNGSNTGPGVGQLQATACDHKPVAFVLQQAEPGAPQPAASGLRPVQDGASSQNGDIESRLAAAVTKILVGGRRCSQRSATPALRSSWRPRASSSRTDDSHSAADVGSWRAQISCRGIGAVSDGQALSASPRASSSGSEAKLSGAV